MRIEVGDVYCTKKGVVVITKQDKDGGLEGRINGRTIQYYRNGNSVLGRMSGYDLETENPYSFKVKDIGKIPPRIYDPLAWLWVMFCMFLLTLDVSVGSWLMHIKIVQPIDIVVIPAVFLGIATIVTCIGGLIYCADNWRAKE